MPTLLLLALIVFCLLPYDAQIAIIALVKAVPREIWLGLLGASMGAMLWYSWGWNSLANQLHRDDVSKADKQLADRRR